MVNIDSQGCFTLSSWSQARTGDRLPKPFGKA